MLGRLPSITRCGTTRSARALGADLVRGLAEGERLGLGEDVRGEDVVVVAERVERLREADEVDRDRARCPGGSAGRSCAGRWCPARPSRPRRSRSRRRCAVERHVLAVGLHRELLQVGGEPLQVLVVGHHAEGLGAEEVRRTRPRAARAAPAGSARAARCGSARPSRGTRRAARRSAPGRSRASSTARSPSPSSSDRRPSPRSRTCWRCRCRRRATRSALVETATKCLATAASSPSASSEPRPGRRRVRQRLERREGLGGDDEQRLAGSRSRSASTRSVASTLETKRNVEVSRSSSARSAS